MSRYLRSIGLLLPGALVTIMLLVAGDLQKLIPQAGRFIEGFGDALVLVLLLGGIYIFTGLFALLFLAAILLLVTGVDPALTLYRYRCQILDLLSGQNGEPRRGARLLSALMVLSLAFALTYFVTQYLLAHYNTHQLIALTLAAGAVAAAIVLLVLYSLLWKTLARIARLRVFSLVIHARTVVLLALLACMGLAFVALFYERQIFKEIDGYRLYLPVAALGLFVAVTLGPAEAAQRWLRPRLTPVYCGLVGVTLLGGWLAFFAAPSNQRVRALVTMSGRTAADVFAFWSMLFDVDGDGIPSVLGGGDCAAFAAHIFPGAVDIPDNGIDEDCFDGDLTEPGQVTPAVLSHPLSAVEQPDIVLFTIDGCRRDYLGIYGAPKDRTPHLDQFATGAVVFEDAIAPSSWTTPSFAAILTSRYASEIPGYYGTVSARPVPRHMELLQTPLKKAGYYTAAVTAGVQLDKLGLNRDFHDWKNLSRGPHGNYGQRVVKAALDVLKKADPGRPLLLWVHLIDAHYPYEAPAEHRKFGSGDQALYAAELHYADSAFGSFMQGLALSGRDSRTVVAVFADHGEAFGEHGKQFHGHTVYAEEVRVPLLLRVPGADPARIRQVVGLVDVVPTIWDLAGVDSKAPVRGVSLAPAIVEKKPPPVRAIFSEQTRYTQEFGLTTEKYRFRLDKTHNYFELFDRAADPTEQNNLAMSLPQITLQLRRQLAQDMAPIAYMEGRRLEQVLLRGIPKGYSKLSREFEEGPQLVAIRAKQIGSRDAEVLVVMRAAGPLKGKKFSASVELRDSEGKRLGGHRGELTAGAYPGNRWHKGELVQHRARVRVPAHAAGTVQVCVELAVDKRSLPVSEGGHRACGDVPLIPKRALMDSAR